MIEQVAIPRAVYTGTAAQLFDFLATSLRDFIAAHNPGDLKVGVLASGLRGRGLAAAGWCCRFAFCAHR